MQYVNTTGPNAALVYLLLIGVTFIHMVDFVGAKERAEIYEAFENIYPILKNFKKT